MQESYTGNISGHQFKNNEKKYTGWIMSKGLYQGTTQKLEEMISDLSSSLP